MAFINSVAVYTTPLRSLPVTVGASLSYQPLGCSTMTAASSICYRTPFIPKCRSAVLYAGVPPVPPGNPTAHRPDRPEETPSGLYYLCVVLWTRYNHALLTCPLLTKSISASLLVLLSDICAQWLTHCSDSWRLCRFFLYGLLLSGPTGHFWHMALEKLVRIGGARGVLIKVALDQLAFAPLATALFFIFMKTLEGLSLDDTCLFLQSHLFVTMKHSYKLWPMANLFNFSCIPPAHRVVFTSAVSVIWVSFLSLMSNG